MPNVKCPFHGFTIETLLSKPYDYNLFLLEGKGMKSMSSLQTVLFCFSLLFVILPLQQALAFENSPIGWASYDTVAHPDSSQTPALAGTTGGAGGNTVTVTTQDDLRKWAGALMPDNKTHPVDVSIPGPYIIQVQGTITLTGRVDVMPNRTIIGIGTDPTIIGELRVRGAGSHPSYNVIVRNLIIRDNHVDDKDAVTIQENAHHVWVDHCDLSNCGDGLTDISHASDYITVSWNHYHDHDKTCLLGHSDGNASEDTGHLKVTYHHNFFDSTSVQRHPRVRFSFLCHVFNNFYIGSTNVNNYGIASTCNAYVLVEGNYFQDMPHPMWSLLYSGSPNGWLLARNNILVRCGTPQVNPPTSMPEPSTYYPYTVDNTADIPTIVTNGAGVNKIYDSTPPTPNPMTFATLPTATGLSSIAMIATTATDPAGVEYYFHCTTAGGHDSGWQTSTTYTDMGLAGSTTYTYQVKARDGSLTLNETAYSDPASATTQEIVDSTAPSPNPMTWSIAPAATGMDTITMTASTATDLSGVEYFFANVTDPGHNSSWQDSTSYTDTGLNNLTTYAYTVTARDKSSWHNQTAPSESASATTLRYNCTTTIAADFNHDCQVDFVDFALMATNWLVCNIDPPSSCL
jgi:pectate lyase